MKKQWQSQLPLDNIQSIAPVSGGDVNEAYRVETSQKPYFLLIQRQRSKAFLMPKLLALIYLKKLELLRQ